MQLTIASRGGQAGRNNVSIRASRQRVGSRNIAVYDTAVSRMLLQIAEEYAAYDRPV